MIKNKQSMKIYTEEQVRQAIKMADKYHHILDSEEIEIVSILEPIELPSDEEIKEYINSTPYYGHCTPEYCEGIEDGIKWVINKIQGGNNEQQ